MHLSEENILSRGHRKPNSSEVRECLAYLGNSKEACVREWNQLVREQKGDKVEGVGRGWRKDGSGSLCKTEEAVKELHDLIYIFEVYQLLKGVRMVCKRNKQEDYAAMTKARDDVVLGQGMCGEKQLYSVHILKI